MSNIFSLEDFKRRKQSAKSTAQKIADALALFGSLAGKHLKKKTDGPDKPKD